MTRPFKLAACVLLLGGLVAATTPWRMSRDTVADAFGPELVQGMELRAVVAGPVSFKLLPRPRVQATGVSVRDETGAIMVDAPLLKADLDIPSLLRGAWRMSAVTLVEPTVAVDLDRVLERPTPARGGNSPSPIGLRMRGGVVRLRSSSASADVLATDVDASIGWTAATLGISGAATWRGTRARFTADLGRPRPAPAPPGAPARLQVDSPLFTVAADGLLSSADPVQFTGRASLATPSLPTLLRTVDAPPMAPGARRVQIGGDIVAKPHDLSLSNVRLRLDQSRFEGTLGWRREDGRGLLAGTLATERLDVDALVGDALDRRDLYRLYQRPFTHSPLDIDLRVSATAARIGRLSIEDAAIAALVRGDRLELSVDGAQAYGGFVKARALATLGPQGLDAHAELSAKAVDLARLSDGLTGHDRVGGLLTGSVEVDGRGASLEQAVTKSVGGGRIGVEKGRLSGLSLARLLRRLGQRLPADANRPGSLTTFDSAAWDVSVKDGVLRIPDGKLTAPGLAMSFGAATHLPDGRIDVHAVAAETDETGDRSRNGSTLPFDMSGFWAGPLKLTARDSALPGLVLPLVDGLSADP